MRYILRGKFITDTDIDIDDYLTRLDEIITVDLSKPPLAISAIISALDVLGQKLAGDENFLTESLIKTGLTEQEAHSAKNDAAAILDKKSLHLKIKRELSEIPLEITRLSSREPYLEGYMPLGVLGHVTSANDAFLPFLSAVEGLITGNINIIKTAAEASEVAMELAAELCATEPRLEPYLYIFPFSSSQKERLSALFACCNGVAVWGSDEAVRGVADLAPSGVSVIAWGHRISFAYVTKAGNSAEALEGIAEDVCVNEQQACSAPQIVYYETEDKNELTAFAKQLFKAMETVSPRYPKHEKSDAEYAELTSQTEIAKLTEIMGDGAAFCGEDFRIFVNFAPSPETSPLFRTILVKPITRGSVIKVLRPYRSYLQTAGLAACASEVAELSNLFYKAGVTRVVSTGMMMSGYAGEPHDGVYALSRYVKRVSLENRALPETIADLKEMLPMREKPFGENTPIIGKTELPGVNFENEGYLLLKSGGSSGKSVYAPHKYGDSEMTYMTAGRAMLTAGIEPADICMNLFYSGSLYGGFLSMYEGLKYIDAVQLPMGASMDFKFVAQEIVSNKVTVIMGMPTYIIKLFHEEKDALKSYGGIRLVLYGGEHINPKQAAYLESEFGVQSVKSLVYGCNEIGSVGYVCEYCKGGEHHLFSSKYMEILKIDRDEPVNGSETGRIILTNTDKENIDVNRYEIGDLGRFITEPCPCGRRAPKFELLGRYGDIFKFATNYVNYNALKSILAEHLNYVGNFQIVLENKNADNENETLKICVDKETNTEKFIEVLSAHSPEINEVLTDKTGTVLISPQNEFFTSSAGGKVRNVVDLRR